ncbi:MAG TPA: serine/threonine-protein kinase [Myxococcaceae bacterium]|nr:serine/threonine-protein kinase [Myxococcaceae bacterium]
MNRTPEPPTPLLPVGTQVRDWRVVALEGQGAYGAVYRAVPVGQESSGPVAIKMSVSPWDARFVREAELLSRLSLPGIPRLLGRGVLRHAVSGAEHPWLAMEWVEGPSLYAWAEQHAPSYPELCRVLAQLARTLEAVHVAGAVHRDVKGDNVLVRLSDSRPVLIDFGSGHIQGVERLTWQALAPGTPQYQSPQSARFEIGLARHPNSYYAPTPADDLFALGVTAYRLVMGQHPPALDVQEDEQERWHVTMPDPRPLLEGNPRVQPVLREWILRLLSEAPEQRGSMAQLAEALEAEALKRPSPPAKERAWRPWLALAAAAVAVLAVVPWSRPEPAPVSPEHMATSSQGDAQAQVPDAGTAAVGERAPTEPRVPSPPEQEQKSVSQDSPFIPDPKQPRQQASPDAKGRCPGPKQVAFNGGCWIEQAALSAEECTAGGYMYLKGKCYTPVLASPEKTVPTSGPGKGL